MTDQQREALTRLRFNSVEAPDDVWQVSPFHIDGLHTRAQEKIMAGILDAKRSAGPSAVGLALQGQKGVGKTHLLGSVRQLVQQQDGYFFLVSISTGAGFWLDVAESMRSELLRRDNDGKLQLTQLLWRLCEVATVPDAIAKAIVGDAPLTVDTLNGFVVALRRVDALVAVECGDTIRALVLYAAADTGQTETGKDYLAGWEEGHTRQRGTWGLPDEPKPARAFVADLSRVLALTGPSVIAMDQVDSLIDNASGTSDDLPTDPELRRELWLIGDGMMQLREVTRRTLSIVACLPKTWKMLYAVATDTVRDRFTETPILGAIANGKLARELVEKWLGVIYQDLRFVPPHPAWPVATSAFAEPWIYRTPRQLLRRIQQHAEACLNGEIRELASFDEQPIEVPPVVGQERDLTKYDRMFAELRNGYDVAPALDPHTENAVMPELIHAGLVAAITELGNDDESWVTEPPDADGQLHAGLNRTLDEEGDIKERWAFRVVAPRHGISILRVVRGARAAVGIRPGARNLHLVLLYHGTRGWGGKVTKAEVSDLARLGSPRLLITEDDVRTLHALKEMLTKQNLELLHWLVTRQPASQLSFLRAVLPRQEQVMSGHQETRPPPGEKAISLGMDDEIRIELESLRKHAVIFAGSGAGKTVLLRRIVEECALHGVSAIVLDPNNDLARLGDAWPQPPAGWRPADTGRAAEYLANTEVVVWTPGRASGRPLSFHPLPDFAGVRGDADEFDAAIGAAVASLIPHARLGGVAKGAMRGQAVLREALAYYARRDDRSLSGFVDLLADLPVGVSSLSAGIATAADLAETLRAAMVNDPLLGGAGEPVDPSGLLTPAPGNRARISVISFVGLPSDEQRQGFISRLQLEVFAWVKRNPAADRPLGGLFVMDEAQTIAPAGGSTASTQSTILLASQARKYGLGLLLATQAPKGVHNQVIGNATTQFFGRLNSPTQIAAANDMARAKGSDVGDISRLERGQFYVTGETFGFRQLRAPLCLSYHPPSPLRLEEVLDRARNGHAREL